jgi:acyl-CoA synthetase (AMP-forming)/AMP-acid ligase II
MAKVVFLSPSRTVFLYDSRSIMETPLSPLDFARRARRLYADREAVVDGSLRFTYREFFERCDRWSAALQKLGVQPSTPCRKSARSSCQSISASPPPTSPTS